MRLIHFITEQEKLYGMMRIEKDCKPFLKQLKGSKGLLLRGSHKKNLVMMKVRPRQDRIPMSTPKILHKEIDEVFNKKFGWKPRSTGVFCTGRESKALYYGWLNSVWPIGNFKFLWSPQVDDLFDTFWDGYEETTKKWIGNTKDQEELVKTYLTSDLPGAINSGNEIMVGCKAYYMLSDGYSDMLKDMFL